MKVELRANDRLTIAAEGDSHTELFEELAGLQEVFGEEKCGKCHGSNFRFQVRKDEDENKYYELRCLGYDEKAKKYCNAKLAYGCHKKGGGLFPKRKEEVDGKSVYKGSNGWVRWNPDTKKEE